MAITAQFQIKNRPCSRRAAHDADRFAGHDRLPDNTVNAGKPGKKAMISLAVFNDQELPVTAENAREHLPTVVGGNHLGMR